MKKKLSEEFVKELSELKGEPLWMRSFRLKSFQKFLTTPNPSFGPKIDIEFNTLCYYKGEYNNMKSNWAEVEQEVRNTFKTLGVINAEEKYLGGVANQYESEVIYHKTSTDKEIIFTSTDEALKKHETLFKKYFNNLVKYDENKYTALNGALWSGGTFIYIPPYTKVDRPLQSYFRIDSKSLGQFERTIIILDEGAELNYIEGCTALSYSANSLHAGVVELYVGKKAKCRYTTIQNWSNDVYNLVTKRAIVDSEGTMEWIDGNIGSKVTMKYPSVILKGDNSVANSISIAYAKENQVLDAGAKMVHLGKNTKSNIVSKSIAQSGGVANYRGLARITKKALSSCATVKCDTIIIDNISSSNTYPKNICENNSSFIEHEATVSKVNEEKLFYLTSKGLTKERATELLVMSFIGDFKKELPMEYAVELNRLLKS